MTFNRFNGLRNFGSNSAKPMLTTAKKMIGAKRPIRSTMSVPLFSWLADAVLTVVPRRQKPNGRKCGRGSAGRPAHRSLLEFAQTLGLIDVVFADNERFQQRYLCRFRAVPQKIDHDLHRQLALSAR